MIKEIDILCGCAWCDMDDQKGVSATLCW